MKASLAPLTIELQPAPRALLLARSNGPCHLQIVDRPWWPSKILPFRSFHKGRYYLFCARMGFAEQAPPCLRLPTQISVPIKQARPFLLAGTPLTSQYVPDVAPKQGHLLLGTHVKGGALSVCRGQKDKLNLTIFSNLVKNHYC